jgi:hypothetical protein
MIVLLEKLLDVLVIAAVYHSSIFFFFCFGTGMGKIANADCQQNFLKNIYIYIYIYMAYMSFDSPPSPRGESNEM